jgi:uncharacterized protein
MKNNVLILTVTAIATLCGPAPKVIADSSSEHLAAVCAAYERSEAMIPMRDGIRLFTVIYRPKQSHEPTGILLDRTPYMNTNPPEPCPSRFAALFDDVRDDGYILVRQSIRGRGNSEGTFILASPLRHYENPKATDEATDAWDTVDWLVKNITENNGKVALLGISYDAMLALMAATDPHPALVAVSPQASPIDFWVGDDFWRNGAFRLNYGFEYAARMELSPDQQPFPFDDADTFAWYLNLGSLKNVNDKYFRRQSEFWNNEEQHRRYDEYWRSRNPTRYLKNIRIPVLTTGGWWDAEDFYGPMESTKTLSRDTTDPSKNHLVVGPWTHGGWTYPRGVTGHSLAKIDFGSDTARYWRHEVQRPWLAHWVLGQPDPNLPVALSFRTGTNQWMRYDAWPPKPAHGTLKLYLSCDGTIIFEQTAQRPCRKGYVSDPANPVPYLPRPIGPLYGGKNFGGQEYHSPWSDWQAQDQRFSTRRPDTLLFVTASLKEDVVLTGEAELTLHVATTGTDGDFIAKLLDIYPGIDPEKPALGGYHLMLNHIVLSGRYLQDVSNPRPLTPGRVYELKFRFMGNDHAFLKGHQIAIQVQSTLFPVIARNPQTYVDDIFQANAADFHPARIDVVFGPKDTNVLSIPRN